MVGGPHDRGNPRIDSHSPRSGGWFLPSGLVMNATSNQTETHTTPPDIWGLPGLCPCAATRSAACSLGTLLKERAKGAFPTVTKRWVTVKIGEMAA